MVRTSQVRAASSGKDSLYKDLPPRPFLYTVDQIASILSVNEKEVVRNYLWLDGRHIGRRDPDRMMARNIAPPQDKPDWRVAEMELIRWGKRKGFRFHNRGWVE